MNATYDGNILAGPMSEIFVTEMTSAVVSCAGCGHSTVVAELAVYGPDPGLVARCPGCGEAVLRLARTPTSVWLDVSGMRTLRLPGEGSG
ncbi:MAG TPA: DUF6510 family protein [Propionibacteriaceae bacterium]|jgi:ribosomal protein S27E|nr:DUF6510 family protein [Propionibacteriaceae bacterium]